MKDNDKFIWYFINTERYEFATMTHCTDLQTFLFHDYETFGTSPSLDRPAQFAAIRTDAELNVLGEPEVFYCKPADDYLPQPQAVMITGITPQEALAKGDNEAAFARRIHDLFTVPQTCIVGYNNVRFDDEVTRNIFYRNFYDPYAWSWQHDNSRWDLLDVMRACYALRPEGLTWPENDEGLPILSFAIYVGRSCCKKLFDSGASRCDFEYH